MDKKEELYLVLGGIALVAVVVFLGSQGGGGGTLQFASANPSSVAAVYAANAADTTTQANEAVSKAQIGAGLLTSLFNGQTQLAELQDTNASQVQETALTTSASTQQVGLQTAAATKQLSIQAAAATAVDAANNSAAEAIATTSANALTGIATTQAGEAQTINAQNNSTAKQANTDNFIGNIFKGITSFFGFNSAPSYVVPAAGASPGISGISVPAQSPIPLASAPDYGSIGL